jgi:phosphoribosyl 1,2-cyclic phosphodiesterase
MKIKFRGVRGSFPVSSATHMRYGGNTSCVEVMTGGGPTIVIDAVTGIREVGKEIVARGDSKQVELLLSHTHWDHIQGLPYFAPLYDAAASVRVHSLKRQAKSLRDILCEQQRPPFFPVALE